MERLDQIARELGVVIELAASPHLLPPRQVPSFMVPDDERKADAVLGQLKIEAGKPQSKRLRRLTTIPSKTHTYDELHAALSRVVSENGLPGVVEVLIKRFGVVPEGNSIKDRLRRRASNIGIVPRIGSTDNRKQRDELFHAAVEVGREEFVQLFAPWADQSSLDRALGTALEKRQVPIVECLLRYGANSALYEDAFVTCAQHGDIELLRLLLCARLRLSEACITRSLLPATTSGSLGAVLLLVQAGADGSHESAAALRRAVELNRTDLVVAITRGQNRPSGVDLNAALEAVVSSSTSLNAKLPIIEVLLCAGAVGNAANEALFKATLLADIESLQLLLSHKVDINYNEASAVAHAIQGKRSDLVTLLLEKQTLKPEYASELVRHIPRSCQSTERIAILSQLLLHGASGMYCNMLLIICAEENDVNTAHLLVSYGRERDSPVCSVDFNAAQCLQVAVTSNSVPMLKVLALEGRPTKGSLAAAFSTIPPNLNKNDHFLIVQTLLRGGAQGSEVTDALQTAVTGHKKSVRLVELLVKFGAVVTDECLCACVSQGSAEILEVLVTGPVSPIACAEGITIAMKLYSSATRFRLIKTLLGPATSAGFEVPAISAAVIDVLRKFPGDIKLLALLCREGGADISFRDGLAVELAMKQKDPVILNVILRNERNIPTPPTIEQRLKSAMGLPLADANRRVRVEAILWRVKPQDAIDQALIKELESASTSTQGLGVVEALLSAGADVNSYNATPLCLAINQITILDLLVSKRPSHESLSLALSAAMKLQTTRLSVCERLLKAGAHGDGVSKALCIAAKEGPSALPLMKLLLPQADVNFKDGRVWRYAIREKFIDALELLLTSGSSPTSATKASAFQEAMKLKLHGDRYRMAQILLKTGVPEQVTSDALIAAVNFAQIELVGLLLQSGASVEHKNGAAVHSAASSGQHGLLELLVQRKPTLSTLTSGLGGALAVKGKPEAYYPVLETLLKAGMRGEPVDAALVEAVQDKDDKATELLFKHNASIEFRDGEALVLATQHASIQTLSLFLERPVPQYILAKLWTIAVKLPRNERCQVIQLLLKAGKAVDGHVSKALTGATTENPSDRKLIKILLGCGAFDRGEAMASAAKALDLRTLTILASSPKANRYISPVFKDFMSTGIKWDSATGLAIVELFLKKGATGDAVAEGLSQAVERSRTGTALAGDFLEVFLRYGDNSNSKHGLALQRAARQVDVELIKRLLPTANVESKAVAMPYLFASAGERSNVRRALEAFSDSLVGTDKDEIVLFAHPDNELGPILFQALRQHPRDKDILRILLDIGYNPNQWQLRESEPWPILCWALEQPEKKISSAVIEMLIDRGADVNFESKSGITPVSLAIQSQRSDIVLKLLNKGAHATKASSEGITPLNLAGSFANTEIIGHLLQAGAETNDGSLHDFSRQLRCDAIQTLVKNGHDVDYPSDRHEGRSALAELCLRAMDHSPSPAKLEEAIRCLILHDANIREVNYSGKTIFHCALDSVDPVTILGVLLKTMWKYINEDAFLFSDGRYTYSLTKYVEKGLFAGPQHCKAELLRLLRNKRAKDRFWANSIEEDQPEDYCNAPPHIEAEVLLQRSRRKRQAEQREDVQRQLELKHMTTVREAEIMNIMTEAELARDRQRGTVERELLSHKAITQRQIEIAADISRDKMLKQRHHRQEAHQRQLRDIQVSAQKASAAEESEKESLKNMMAIEFHQKQVEIRNDGVRSRLAIEESAFQHHEKALLHQHEREMTKIRMQKQLVERQPTFAGTYPRPRLNQIGYVTET
ncbi:hypothetical protein LZ554_007712 [Drepanopeziza brunnea f. sp. 'monogermtubi']|nr:hypothetical protein LZ554_007712 [Drepanopeziza brunnea f. sp. 'monogermtubi']